MTVISVCLIFAEFGHKSPTTLADITTGEGMHLLPECLERQFKTIHHANRSWPPGGQPNAHCWTLWKAALTICFIQPDDTHQRLCCPLGAWLKQPQHWKWFYSPNQNSLFEQEHECSWISHARKLRYTHTQTPRFPKDSHPIPTTASRCPTDYDSRTPHQEDAWVTTHSNINSSDGSQMVV
jgi:hypothetical protein